MSFDIKYFKLKRDIDRVHILHWAHFVVLILFTFSEITNSQVNVVYGLFKMAVISAIYHLFYRTVKSLYYTFWAFTGVLGLYLITNIVEGMASNATVGVVYLLVLGLIFLSIEAYILSSPIYYPRVSWWEYDFRYRNELKTWVTSKTMSADGRLGDLRRGAGYLSSFRKYSRGEKLQLRVDTSEERTFEVEIMSKRQYSLGRPVTYGIKFHFKNEEEENNYFKFCDNWKSDKNLKKKQRFKVKSQA